ncbi:MAG: 16S rRNA (cytidine(1402)-2'-O)-methyltransferase [Rhodobacteraceae bacterium]|nr:16S rRNA (cytidine(1402)-2'-O)-methyltransferase [Paracoccaceae bacterium]
MIDSPPEPAPGQGVARRVALKPGLYFVATPIGAVRDITLKSLDILLSADVIAAEDTRTVRKLMVLHGIPLGKRPLVTYHDHNGPAQRPRILTALADGKSVAYVSEAGTPLIADPGFPLGRAALEAGNEVFAAPGPSASLVALTVSGLPSDRFYFAGFPPSRKGALTRWAEGLRRVDATLIIYESPKRIHQLLDVLTDALGAGRQVALCRELTKRFEEVLRGSLAEVTETIAERRLKGETVLVIDRGQPTETDAQEMEYALREMLKTRHVKEAVDQVAARSGLPKRVVYQSALALGRKE